METKIATIRKNASGAWDVIAWGMAVVRDESYQVADNIAYSLNHGARGTTECDEVARAILGLNRA